MKQFVVTIVTFLSLVGRPARAEDAPLGNIAVEITDKAGKGVAGITLIATANGAAQTVKTGAEQPADAELAAAARTGAKAVDALVSKFAARAVLARLPLSTVTVIIDIKGAKPLTLDLSKDKTAWRLTANINPKTKQLIGVPKVTFDELAHAKVIAAFAQSEQEKSRVELEHAKAEQERIRAEAEKNRLDQEAKSAQDKARADDEAKHARDQAAAERRQRQRQEAPSRIAVNAIGCRCAKAKQIIVICSVTSQAEVPVEVTLSSTAETGSFSMSSKGKSGALLLSPGQNQNVEVSTRHDGLMDCGSCKAQKCAIASAIAK